MMTAINLLILIISILFFSGCSGPPFDGGILPRRQPQVIQKPTDFKPLAEGMKFVGICSVVCSSIWGASLITTANIRRKTYDEYNR